ncbi:MAG: uracil-DNA glycosylase family protein [Gammaproteobacteria bacterium]|nr:uracil-DNA glycosylase family protein [Gammaproteobacteria bacterium]
MSELFTSLISDVRSCTICAGQLKHGVRPVLQASSLAKILIAGQAPGSRVHATGVPFDDPSGDRLRHWMGVDRETFYDPERVAILPMGFCYPGKGKSGDLPPLAICAETWRARLLAGMPNIQLTLVIGQYAIGWHLDSPHKNLTETVRNWKSYSGDVMPLPHPSPRNNIWLAKNPWFESELLDVLRARISAVLR